VDTLTIRNEPTGRWSLIEYRPRHLAGLVMSIWHFVGLVPEARERHVADGLVRLVIPLEGAFDLVKRWTRQRCPTASFTGLQTSPMFIEGPASRAAVLGIQLYPAGAYGLIGAPLTETTDQLSDLGDLVGAPAAEFAERCAAASSAEARVRIAADWVSQRIARSPGLDPRVAVTRSRIERNFGALPIGMLHEAVGLSKKRLIAAFRRQVGVTPKTYARIVRFRRAMELLGDGCPPASVAVIAGYYDQPHMNLEFRELAGVTPGGVLATIR
jgi:AraC-like DNA-binding protein